MIITNAESATNTTNNANIHTSTDTNTIINTNTSHMANTNLSREAASAPSADDFLIVTAAP